MPIELADLTVEHAREPVGIDVVPRFGWSVTSADRGVVVTGWSISVRGPAGTVWDSGWVSGSGVPDVEYAGAPLASLTAYDWEVEVASTHGSARAASRFVTGVLDGDWRGAAWIGGRGPAAPLLRHEFTLPAAPASALLVVAAGGYARVELDGSPVEPRVLSPGFVDYDESVQYTVTEVADRLSAGRHALGIELGRGFFGMLGANTWNWESAPWHAEPCVRALLFLRGPDGDESVVTTSGAWRTIDGPTRLDDLYAGEDYDARRERPGFAVAGFDDGAWRAAVVVPGPRGALVRQRQQPIGVAEVLRPDSVVQLQPDRWVARFERVIAGWVEVEADGPAGSTIELRSSERLRADGSVDVDDPLGYYDGRFQTDRVTLAGGPLRWEPRFGYKGFQYVEVRAAALPTLRAKVVHSLVDRTGDFECSSPLLTRLHELTVATVLNNLHGLPTDTPQFEKNGWTGDGMLGAELMLLNLDVHELLAKWSADIAASRHGIGAPAVIAPFGGWRADWSPAPTWHSALLLVPWEVHRHRDDTRLLREIWPDARDYLRFELARSPGGIATTTLGDWVGPETDAGGGNPPEDPRVCATAFLVAMCDTAARIAAVLGEDPREWTHAGARSRRAFVETFLDRSSWTVRGEGDAGYRQAHAVLALTFDVLPVEDRQPVADRLARDVAERDFHLWTGALATKHLLPVLTRFGHARTALAIAEQTTFPSWGFWVEQGATSLWEHWKPESRSRGHYFLGTLDDWLYGSVLGIAPLEPGWRRIRIAPAVWGLLGSARGGVRTPHGRLDVAWADDDGSIHLEVRLPIGTTAAVGMPSGTLEVGPGRHAWTFARPPMR